MTDVHDDVSTVTVTVNGTEIRAAAGELLIDACERTGTYIPRFCHHSRMNPCLLYTSPSPRDATLSRMPSSA